MNAAIRILIVDDDGGFINILKKIFMMKENFITKGYTNPKEALLDKDLVLYDIILVDLIMPEMNGLEFLSQLKERFPLKPVIVLTGQGSIDTAVEAMRLGAVTFIEKPINPDLLLEKIYQVLDYKEGITSLKEFLMDKKDEKLLVGNSKAMEQVRKNARIVAQSDASILITGESGTGKELVAELIYKNSNRYGKPFIRINCAALPETLFESELFGYLKGAFTGADKDKKGKIEQAEEGTLFLDEIGDLPLSMQTKLLRVLQQKEIEKIGGNCAIKVDVRLIFATNRNLEKAIEDGLFREDLYYRLSAVTIDLPPLRERPEDIKDLIEHYFIEFGKETKKDIPLPSTEILKIFMDYPWPGNAREVRNLVERIFVFGESKMEIKMENLPEKILSHKKESTGTCPEVKALREIKHDFERNYLIDILECNDWNITQTALQIGLSRRNLQKKIKLLNIAKP